MKDRVIQGIITLLFLLSSSAAVAETVIIDFYGPVLNSAGSPPPSVGSTLSGHVEFNSDDIIPPSPVIDSDGDLEIDFNGLGSFGSASGEFGWSFAANPGGQWLEVDIVNNYSVTFQDLMNKPAGMGIGLSPGSLVDILEFEVYQAGFDFVTGAGELFGGVAIFLGGGTNDVVNDDLEVDVDQLFDSAFYLGFWAGEMEEWGDDLDELDDVMAWYVEGTAEADISIVPIPAAVWLFGSGLLGLVGVAKRRRAAA